MVYHNEPPKFSNLHYKDDSKCLISQNEKENQKTDIVNMYITYIVVLCINITNII